MEHKEDLPVDAMEKFRGELSRFFESLWPAEEKPLVFGEGQWHSPDIMLIGEAPGEQETLQGRPFVGKAGKNLDGFLDAVGLRREDIYISNVVKVRPVKISAKGTVSNRPPNREELALFTPWLLREIMLVQPQTVVTLGNVALKTLLGQDKVIGQCHGVETAATVTAPEAKNTLPCSVYPLYHPASIIYNRALVTTYQEDLQNLRELLVQRGVVN